MNTGGANIAGYRLAGHTWVDDLGTWSSAVSADGRPGTALRFDPQLITDRATRDRLVSAVIADRRLAQSGMTGLVPIADLITAQDEIWLLTAAPVSPTVADLLSDVPGIPRPDAGSAATVLVEVAQTLLAVHASGLSHGALHPGTVVIAPDGSALLAERGLADALLGRPPLRSGTWRPGPRSRGAWPRWAPHDPRSAGLLDRAAATASDLGLAPARDVLLAGRDLLPPGFVTRDRLVEIMRRRAERDMPTQVRRPARTPVTPDQGEIVTLLGAPRPGERPTEDVVMRFGPGVPSGHHGRPDLAGSRDQQWTEAPAAGSRAGRVPARQRRGRTILASVILALMVLGGLALWLFRGSSAPLEVAGVDVVAPKKTQGCDTTVKIVGVLSTNGSAGEVRYQWKRSDRKAPITQTDQVMAGKTSHEVSLEWTVKGEGSFKGTATLQVLSPLPQGRKLQDKATFTYKCS
ncbi:hypothetical protein ACFQX6_56595 [Streptosporangium lutulentum]